MPRIDLDTPTGPIRVVEQDGAIVSIGWIERIGRAAPATPLLAEARRQLDAYFAGGRAPFDLPVRTGGAPFQEAVWRAMRAIPYGEVRTYGDLARELGSNPRAVGTACGRNPVPIVIPCHRVVGSGGRMTGFSGGRGIETKSALLALEGAMLV